MSVLQSLAQLTSSQIVNCFVLGIAIAAIAGAASAVVGRNSSGVRFAIWFAGLIAVVGLFVLPKPVTGGAAAGHLGTLQIWLRPEWALYIFGAWALFAVVGIARVVSGIWRVRSLKKSSVPVEESGLASIERTLPPISRRFSICTSEHLRVPAAVGFLRPMIILPVWAIRELSLEELSTVILHEAAHLQRWDDWTNLLQKFIRAVLFFHPAVWWIDNRLSIEREMSCDDIVLAGSQSARQYAACLVSLAEKTRAHRSLALVQAAVSRLKHTAERISKILDGNRRTAKPLLKPAMAAVAVFGTFSFVAVQHTPQLVNFRSDTEISSHASLADKFDYVANVNPVLVKAVPASVDQSRTPSSIGTGALHTKASYSNPKPRNRTLEPAPTQEATNRTEGSTPPVENAVIGPATSTVVNAAIGQDAAPMFIYLISQTEQYDGFGNVTVTTSVWRIRVMNPAPAQVQAPVFSHQT